MNDQIQQQHHFQNITDMSSRNASFDAACNCPALLSNVTFIRHGENLPIFVPEDLSAMQLDVLDKLLLNKHSENTVIITIAGYGMRHELYNWIHYMQTAKEKKFVVFCTDAKLYMHLIVAGHEERAALIPEDWFVSSPDLFRDTTLSMLDDDPRLSHVKTWVLQRLVYSPVNALMLDVNQFMMHRRTREYIQTLLRIRGDTQIIATQDGLDQRTINTGLLLIRSNAQAAKRILANTIQIQEKQPSLNQQAAFNKALNQMELHVKTGMTVLLDIIHFPNGLNYFEHNLPESKGIKPYIIHANHKFGQDRRDLLKENDFWKVSEDYVDGISYQIEDILKRTNQLLEQQDNQKAEPLEDAP
ncbi:hypothetical protein [Parasitella parasitica]|uniref:Nucleotide-diphospho-sugar transferase domain-containing protein n=1 Tax=Parasitella parasitica TaxID=35722 RepID=A0A0B7NCL6_9FUNG|nr:hypothetical protein [Parasitella parasitica]